MAEGIVVFLEPVEIDHQKGNATLGRQKVSPPFVERPSVGHPCQRIGRGGLAELRLGLDAFAHVADDCHLAYRLDDEGRAQETEFGNALMGAYLTRLGLPTRAVAYIAGAGPADMTWLTAADAERVGINVSLLDIGEAPMDGAKAAPPISPPLSAPSKAALRYVDGLDPNGDNWLALKAAPNLKAKRLRKMGPRTRLQVLEQSGNWLRVRLDDGAEGWAHSKYVACCLAG